MMQDESRIREILHLPSQHHLTELSKDSWSNSDGNFESVCYRETDARGHFVACHVIRSGPNKAREANVPLSVSRVEWDMSQPITFGGPGE